MEIRASNCIWLKDILFGDVWLCSGQSNMAYSMNRLTDNLQVYDFNALKDDYSAGAYFFARDLNEKYHVPIGIINASVGGSPAEA